MNLADKIGLKKDVLLSVGVKVEELLEGAEQQCHEARGGKKALRAHIKNLMGIIVATDEDVGKSIPDLETLSIVKAWLSKMVISTENASKHLENVEIQMAGEVAGHRGTHDMIQKMMGDADRKLGEVEAAVKAGTATVNRDGTVEAAPGERRPAGVRPGMSIKDQRLAEEAQAVEAGKKKPVRRRKAKK